MFQKTKMKSLNCWRVQQNAMLLPRIAPLHTALLSKFWRERRRLALFGDEERHVATSFYKENPLLLRCQQVAEKEGVKSFPWYICLFVVKVPTHGLQCRKQGRAKQKKSSRPMPQERRKLPVAFNQPTSSRFPSFKVWGPKTWVSIRETTPDVNMCVISISGRKYARRGGRGWLVRMSTKVAAQFEGDLCFENYNVDSSPSWQAANRVWTAWSCFYVEIKISGIQLTKSWFKVQS